MTLPSILWGASTWMSWPSAGVRGFSCGGALHDPKTSAPEISSVEKKAYLYLTVSFIASPPEASCRGSWGTFEKERRAVREPYAPSCCLSSEHHRGHRGGCPNFDQIRTLPHRVTETVRIRGLRKRKLGQGSCLGPSRKIS